MSFSPRVLDFILLEIEKCVDKKKLLSVAKPDRECRDEFGSARITQKDRMRECREYDRFSSVALSCHREIVPEVILYYYDVYYNNKYYISTFYKSHAFITARGKCCNLYCRRTPSCYLAVIILRIIDIKCKSGRTTRV